MILFAALFGVLCCVLSLAYLIATVGTRENIFFFDSYSTALAAQVADIFAKDFDKCYGLLLALLRQTAFDIAALPGGRCVVDTLDRACGSWPWKLGEVDNFWLFGL